MKSFSSLRNSVSVNAGFWLYQEQELKKSLKSVLLNIYPLRAKIKFLNSQVGLLALLNNQEVH